MPIGLPHPLFRDSASDASILPVWAVEMDSARDAVIAALRGIQRLLASYGKICKLRDQDKASVRWRKRARGVGAEAPEGLTPGEETAELYGDLLVLRDVARSRLRN